MNVHHFSPIPTCHMPTKSVAACGVFTFIGETTQIQQIIRSLFLTMSSCPNMVGNCVATKITRSTITLVYLLGINITVWHMIVRWLRSNIMICQTCNITITYIIYPNCDASSECVSPALGQFWPCKWCWHFKTIVCAFFAGRIPLSPNIFRCQMGPKPTKIGCKQPNVPKLAPSWT